MEELLSLKWNNHRSTFLHILGVLRDKQSYTDVTLACDGKFYSVHKLVLSTCSDYFCAMFEKTACKSPVIVLKDIKSNDLEALLDYMYLGEVNVRQSDLASLIKAAENLRIKGLAVPDDEPPSKKGSVGAPSRRDGGSGSPPAKRKRRDESEDGREDVRPSLGELHTPPPPSSRPKSPGIQRLSPSPLRTPQESHASEDRDNRPLSSPAETSSTHSQAQIPHQSSQQSSLQSAQQLGDQISQPMGNQFRGEETPYVKVEMTDDETDGANRDTYSISSENFKEEGDVGGELSNDLPEFLQQAASSALAGTSASYHQSFAGPSGFQPEVSSWHGDGQSLPGNFPGIGFPPTSQENPPGVVGGSVGVPEETDGPLNPSSLVGPGGAPDSVMGAGLMSGAGEAATAPSADPFQGPGCGGDSVPALQCPDCGKLFYGRNRRQLVERHRIIHTGERPFQCPLCFKRMNVKHHLTRHLRTVHLNQWEHLSKLNLV
ncbi:longitudinals lacking protein, isoforms H/M/V-like isoform X10 [Macrobrachium rosenbergii]|uniref:longitudinals lacking protein, isoforms H/M/V-like isoform X10 n=1 Tax=Macrobrachium rosenbergii TaxID=79674 RepID=UPI0034D51F77